MNKVLLQDIVIKAGTVFRPAAPFTRRAGVDNFSCIIGLTNDTSGEVCYCIDTGDPEMKEWFKDEK